jgi:hypothetical protein
MTHVAAVASSFGAIDRRQGAPLKPVSPVGRQQINYTFYTEERRWVYCWSWAKVHAVEVIRAADYHCLLTEWETWSDIDLIATEIVAVPRSYNILTADN